MKKAVCISTCVVLGAMLLLGGCEADPASGTVVVSPNSTTIQNGQAISFSASGGFEYQWSLNQESYGTLSTRSGATTTYTSRISPGAGTNLTQIIRVTSIVSGATTTNNTQVTSGTAEAYVTHVN